MIETKSGNSFIAQTDEKTYKKILRESGYDPKAEIAKQAFESEGSTGLD